MHHNYLFIDECGDPEFYGKRKKLLVGEPGYQPLLILGLVETSDRKELEKAILEFQKHILTDSLYRSIYTVQKPDWFLHARKDHPEVRSEFFKFIRTYSSIRFHAVIARKDLEIFNHKHNNNPSEFYFDLVHHLLQNRLTEDTAHKIYLAHKPKTTLKQLVSAVDKAIEADNRHLSVEKTIVYDCQIQQSSQMPELSVVDYFLWALHRYLIRGEVRFWETVEQQVGSVIDLYDHQREYDGGANRLRLEKIKPFDWMTGQ
ncbi:hypothetical protein [Spirosoma litoris]